MARSLKTRHNVRWVSSRCDEANVILQQWFHVQQVTIPDSIRGLFSEQHFRSELAGLMWSTDFAASAAFVVDLYGIWKQLQMVLPCSNCTYSDLHPSAAKCIHSLEGICKGPVGKGWEQLMLQMACDLLTSHPDLVPSTRTCIATCPMRAYPQSTHTCRASTHSVSGNSWTCGTGFLSWIR